MRHGKWGEKGGWKWGERELEGQRKGGMGGHKQDRQKGNRGHGGGGVEQRKER